MSANLVPIVRIEHVEISYRDVKHQKLSSKMLRFNYFKGRWWP